LARKYPKMNIIKVKGYVKENWGSPFLVGFIFLIIGSGVSLLFGLSYLADVLSVYAFYALVAGFFLQLFCYLRDSPNIQREVP